MLALAVLAVACTPALAAAVPLSVADGGLAFPLACRASSLASVAAASAPAWAPPAGAECVARPPVPGTALHALLQNGSFAHLGLPAGGDPYVDALLGALPDIAFAGAPFYTFAYIAAAESAALPCSPTPPPGARVLLTLAQASYRVTAYLDGAAAPLPLLGGGAQAVGMFQRFVFDLGPAAAWCAAPSHGLALLVAPPDHPGLPAAACARNLTVGPCGQGGSHGLAMDVVSQDLGGWDWVAASPDRNTGLLDAVALELHAAGVLLRDGAVGLAPGGAPLRRASPDASAGTLQVVMRASLQSLLQGAQAVAGVVHFSLAGASAAVNVSLPRGASGWLEVTSPPMLLQGVELWWPHTLGAPTLHAASARFVGSAGEARLEWRAGLREVTAEVDGALGGRAFAVNGVRLFVTGGNWIGSDALSRAAYRAPARLRAEVALHAHMGMNAMRLWGGHGGHPDALFAAADELGVLLLAEFWMSGDNNGRWAGSPEWPLDHGLYLRAAADTVRRLRGHASLLLWCGGNELFPFEASPPGDILRGLQAALAALDVARTPFVQSSMGSDERRNFSGFDPARALAPSDGPYGLLEPRSFFARNPGQRSAAPLALAFNPEVGSAAQPEYESLARFLSAGALAAVPGRAGDARAPPLHPAWAFHAFEGWGDDAGGDQLYAYAPRGAAPPAWDAREYCAAAALAQHAQYQALFEGYQEYAWQYYSGVLMWKSAGPWPALRGALYDFYLAPSGGYTGARAALGGGRALHVQLSRRAGAAGGAVTVLNRGRAPARAPLRVTAQAFSLDTGAPLAPAAAWSLPDGLAAGEVLQVPGSALAWPPGAAPGATLLWRLALADGASGAPLAPPSEYLLSTLLNNASAAPADFSALAALRAGGQRLPLACASAAAALRGGGGGLRVVLRGLALAGGARARGVAIGVRCGLRDPAQAVRAGTGVLDDRVLPVLASAGMVALVPGEALEVALEAPGVSAFSASLVAVCEGYNVQSLTVVPTWGA
jgi:mannosylglycoprotein endo-beta-mannosidase